MLNAIHSTRRRLQLGIARTTEVVCIVNIKSRYYEYEKNAYHPHGTLRGGVCGY